MAEVSGKYLAIENATSGLSSSTDNNEIAMDPRQGTQLKESASFAGFGSHFVGLTLHSERRRRVSGGDCEYYQQPNLLRNPLVVRSGNIPDDEDCHPSCPYRGNYQTQNTCPQPSDQYYNHNYQRSEPAHNQCSYYDNRNHGAPQQNHGTHQQIHGASQQNHEAPCHHCYEQQTRTQAQSQSQPKDRHGSECVCDQPAGRRAYRTPSSHYMEYREFQHSPKKNPALEYPPDPQRRNRLQKETSDCSCGCPEPLPERKRVQKTKRLQKQPSECSCESEEKQQVQRSKRMKVSSSDCSCEVERAPRRPPVHRKTTPDKAYYLRKPTPAAQTCPVRCHARSHIQGSPPPPPPVPKRKCPAAAPPPVSRKPTPKAKPTTSAPKAKTSSPRKCSACNRCSDDESDATDYVEHSRSRTEVLRNPLVQPRSYDDHGAPPYESCSEECPVQRRARSPSCKRTKPENRSRSCKEPPICSNETLMEKPVKSYRFNCPENGKCASCRKLCPKCHKVVAQKKKTPSAKKYAASVAQKCCPMCGLLPMMPNISMPNVASGNRIIYKTLGRCRPRKLPKSRYELTICCRKRCQGGRNSHYMTGTIATSLKRRAKAAMTGVNPVAPSGMSSHRQAVRPSPSPPQNMPSHHPVYQSTGHVRSPSRAGHSSPSTPAQQRERPAAPPPFKMRSPSANLVQRSEKREREREQIPFQERTRAALPAVEIHSSARGSSHPREHAHSYRSQPEPGPSNRSQPGPAPSNRSHLGPGPSNRSQPGPGPSNRSEQNRTAPPASSRSRPEPPEIPASLVAPASMDADISEPVRRGASYLGTELNPFYRGSFLRVRQSRDSPHTRLSPIHQRGEHISEVPKSPKVPGMGMPVKYTKLSQLQAWVFGDPFVRGNNASGAWSWRQIFGRRKKQSTSKDKPVKTVEATST
ncbi:serine/arginine repetitive matrix protein 1 [Drosophila teissieri]|uniref:serine/arginine repetitive matrix protein 1 n=1 Tax=Drosophila teissieri TaxID=7243 RepID=UPI001CB9FFAF|nr:serine/arginine repetitive matrix protein 1 [Drosophila teissieri]